MYVLFWTLLALFLLDWLTPSTLIVLTEHQGTAMIFMALGEYLVKAQVKYYSVYLSIFCNFISAAKFRQFEFRKLGKFLTGTGFIYYELT